MTSVSRPSDLTRKYRTFAGDECELVGGAPSPLDFDFDLDLELSDDCSDRSATPIPPGASPLSIAAAASSVDSASSFRLVGRALHERVAATMHHNATTRFPATWAKVVRQACDACVFALMEGHDRLLVAVNKPCLLSGASSGASSDSSLSVVATADMSAGVSETSVVSEIRSHEQPSPSFSTAHLFNVGKPSELSLTIDICNALVARICAGDALSKGSRVRAESRIILFFNSQHEADAARLRAHPSFVDHVRYCALSSKAPDRLPTDICILVAPTSRHGNPSIIEAVELIHYSNWNHSNIVIMLNPMLTALTGFNLDGCARSPSFLSDYLETYYLDPAVFSSKVSTGALLHCYPRKWEMYMLRSKGPAAFRLVAEHSDRPKPERLICDFAWRSEQLEDD
jgi:Domain of unknown function (DUF1995)